MVMGDDRDKSSLEGLDLRDLDFRGVGIRMQFWWKVPRDDFVE